MTAIKKDVTIGDCRFKAGNEPWNKGMKGIHLSPATQWKKGCESNRKLPVGSVRHGDTSHRQKSIERRSRKSASHDKARTCVGTRRRASGGPQCAKLT